MKTELINKHLTNLRLPTIEEESDLGQFTQSELVLLLDELKYDTQCGFNPEAEEGLEIVACLYNPSYRAARDLEKEFAPSWRVRRMCVLFFFFVTFLLIVFGIISFL